MRLTCPECAAEYEVEANLIPERGREVQCSACGTTWVAFPAEEETPPAVEARENHAAPMPHSTPERTSGAPAAAASSEESQPQDRIEGLRRQVAAERSSPADNSPEPVAPASEPSAENRIDSLRRHVATDREEDAAPQTRTSNREAEPPEPRDIPDDDGADVPPPPAPRRRPRAPEPPRDTGTASRPATPADDRSGAPQTPRSRNPPRSERDTESRDASPEVAAPRRSDMDETTRRILREEAAHESSRRRRPSRPADRPDPSDPSDARRAPPAAPKTTANRPPPMAAPLPDADRIGQTLAPTRDRGDERPARRGIGLGFLIVVGPLLLLVALYFAAPWLAETLPAISDDLRSYVEAVNALRQTVGGWFG